MADDTPMQLLAELAAAKADRDAAMDVLDRHHLEAAAQTSLLVEEQDRFVSRLLESHEREVGRLRLELTEARTTAERVEQKLVRERGATTRLEEEIARLHADVTRLRDQRDAARSEQLRVQHAYLALQGVNEHISGDLALARSMLEDAMNGNGALGFRTVPPEIAAHEPSAAPRESGIRRPRRSTPPGTARNRDGSRRSETPLPTGTAPRDSGPPR
jgi:hypothetical protein